MICEISLPSEGGRGGRFPRNTSVLIPENINNHSGHEVIKGEVKEGGEVAVLGMLPNADLKGGRVVVYGDSNCIDSAHMHKDCFWLIIALLEFAAKNVRSPSLLSEIGAKVVLPEEAYGGGGGGGGTATVAGGDKTVSVSTAGLDTDGDKMEKNLLFNQNHLPRLAHPMDVGRDGLKLNDGLRLDDGLRHNETVETQTDLNIKASQDGLNVNASQDVTVDNKIDPPSVKNASGSGTSSFYGTDRGGSRYD